METLALSLVGKIGVVVLGSQNSVPLFHARN